MTLSAALSCGKKLLHEAGIESFLIDAQALLMYVLSFSRSKLFAESELVLHEKDVEHYFKLIKLRSQNMPVAYIINSCEFMSLAFYVDENVLIPRNDTEVLVEAAIGIIKKNNYFFGAEIGVGSGCISVSLVKYCERLKMIGFDISQKAIDVALRNAQINAVENKISFYRSDLFDKFPEQACGKLDFIISNPPYICTDIIPTLDNNVKDFEPHSALDGGADGLDFYRKIAADSKKYLICGGHLLFEIGYNQANSVGGIMAENGLENIMVLQDLSGLDRVVYGSKRGEKR